MLTPLERTTASHKATKPDIDFVPDEEVPERKEDWSAKAGEKEEDNLVKQKGITYFEIDDEVTDLNSKVEKLLDIVNKGETKLELCIDGS